MNANQIEAIPSTLLYETGTAGLREWLHAHGLRMTLLELTNERNRRTHASRRTPQRAERRNHR